MLSFKSPEISGVFLMPCGITKYIKSANANELRVALYIFSSSRVNDINEIADGCGITETEVCSALAFWRGTGLVTVDEEKNNVTVVSETKMSERQISYSSSEIAEAIEQNGDIGSMLNYASQKIGKILTPADQGKLLSLVDTLPLDCAVVMGIIDYCVGNGHSSVRYIERTAARMYEDDGVDTYEKFEKYMEQKNAEKTLETKIRRIIGAGERAFTKKESDVVRELTKKGISEELIAEAYERTIANTAKPSLFYMSKILETWHSEGIKTVSDLEGQKPFDTTGLRDTSLGAFRLEDFTERPKEENNEN